jgi:hypothetical protein
VAAISPGRVLRFNETVPLAMLGTAAGAIACTASPSVCAAVVAVLIAIPLAWFAFSVRHAWIALFFAAAILLPPLPLPWGDSGPHIAPLFAAVGALAAFVRMDEWRVRASFLNTTLLLLLGALSVSVPFAVIHSGALVGLGSAARVLLFSIAVLIYFTAIQNRDLEGAARITRALFYMAVLGAAFGCLDFFFQLPAPAGYGEQFIWLDSGVYRRAQGLFYEASTLGNFCAFFLVMVAVALSDPKGRRMLRPVFLWAGGVVLAAALVASYSRASLAAVAVALATLAVLERKRWAKPRALLALVSCAIAVIALLVFLLPEFTQSYWARIVFSFDNLASRPDRVFSGRLANWSVLGAFMVDHPWQTLLGIGYKTLPYTTHLGKPLIADNMYLSALVETGVLGLSALIAVNIAILSAARRALRRTNSFYAKWIFCFWAGEVVQMFSGDIFTYWRVLPIFFWVLAQAVLDHDHAHPGS